MPLFQSGHYLEFTSAQSQKKGYLLLGQILRAGMLSSTGNFIGGNLLHLIQEQAALCQAIHILLQRTMKAERRALLLARIRFHWHRERRQIAINPAILHFALLLPAPPA